MAAKADKKTEAVEDPKEPKAALVDSHYEDAPDKPDPETVAQIQVIDD